MHHPGPTRQSRCHSAAPQLISQSPNPTLFIFLKRKLSKVPRYENRRDCFSGPCRPRPGPRRDRRLRRELPVHAAVCEAEHHLPRRGKDRRRRRLLPDVRRQALVLLVGDGRNVGAASISLGISLKLAVSLLPSPASVFLVYMRAALYVLYQFSGYLS
jgi:hypothetical protein